MKRSRGCVCPRPATSLCPLTFLASFLPGSVNVVLELDADLPLGGLVTDERELEQLLRRWAAQVSLDETRVNEVDELLRPGNDGGSHWEGPLGRGEPTLTSLLSPLYPNTRLLAPQLQCRPCPPAPSSLVQTQAWMQGVRWRPCPRASFLDANPAETYHFLDLSLGGGFRGMRKRARMGCMSHRAGARKRRNQPLLPGQEPAVLLATGLPRPTSSL